MSKTARKPNLDRTPYAAHDRQSGQAAELCNWSAINQRWAVIDRRTNRVVDDLDTAYLARKVAADMNRAHREELEAPTPEPAPTYRELVERHPAPVAEAEPELAPLLASDRELVPATEQQMSRISWAANALNAVAASGVAASLNDENCALLATTMRDLDRVLNALATTTA